MAPGSKEIKYSGYVCLRSPRFDPPLNLDQFDALELRIKTDGRLYVAQVKTRTNVPEDIYQTILPPLPPNEWHRVVVPFQDFLLTWRGCTEEKIEPVQMDHIEHFGILMAERRNGPFSMHIDWIRAIKQPSRNKI
uniref:NADH:ubiquinone oxidoreductase intermediate-associated protein 30 domain-containing protein n=1 Tax=Arcella intermedia TaxID=1963864 RepID=A0A6B2LQM7_9EUKA